MVRWKWEGGWRVRVDSCCTPGMMVLVVVVVVFVVVTHGGVTSMHMCQTTCDAHLSGQRVGVHATEQYYKRWLRHTYHKMETPTSHTNGPELFPEPDSVN